MTSWLQKKPMYHPWGWGDEPSEMSSQAGTLFFFFPQISVHKARKGCDPNHHYSCYTAVLAFHMGRAVNPAPDRGNTLKPWLRKQLKGDRAVKGKAVGKLAESAKNLQPHLGQLHWRHFNKPETLMSYH